MGEICEDLGHRPLVFVRFNPDRYKDEHGRNVLSPWRTNIFGLFTVCNKWKDAWDARLDKLRQTVDMNSSSMEDKDYEVVHLYY